MFRFEHPEFFIAWIAVPVLVGFYMLYRLLRRQAWKKFARTKAKKRMLENWSGQKEILKLVMLCLGFAFLAIALSNPQWGYRKESVEKAASDIFIALDISNSMLAEDIPPSRLERAKRFAQNLVNQLKGERIGLILFAGNAYLQMPLTTDYAAAQLFIRSAHPRLATSQGTAIGDVIDLTLKAYEDESASHKALILITDGENHDDVALEKMRESADFGLVPFVVAVGTSEGAFIPTMIRGREDYKRDQDGTPVRTRLNEDFIKALARAGKGEFFDIYNGPEVIRTLQDRIDRLEKRKLEQLSFKEYQSYFQYFLFIGLCLLCADYFIGRQRSKKVRISA